MNANISLTALISSIDGDFVVVYEGNAVNTETLLGNVTGSHPADTVGFTTTPGMVPFVSYCLDSESTE